MSTLNSHQCWWVVRCALYVFRALLCFWKKKGILLEVTVSAASLYISNVLSSLGVNGSFRFSSASLLLLHVPGRLPEKVFIHRFYSSLSDTIIFGHHHFRCSNTLGVIPSYKYTFFIRPGRPSFLQHQYI